MSDRCTHPTESIRYYSEIEEDGRVYEEYLCIACNFWMTPSFTEEYHDREDWTEDIAL